MYNYLEHRNLKRTKRAFRVRKKLKGSEERPRLSIHKTNKNLFLQIIDDELGRTLYSVSTLKDSKNSKTSCKSKEHGRKLGEQLAKQALEGNISKLVIDRGRFKYHGVLAEIVSTIREAGIQV